MARKLRIQYPGALYHLINRGNYRRDIFTSAGEAQAFLDTVLETKQLMGWRLHAYALMRNHYHLVVETPEPNLVEGMHWLQSTWATRFNRFREERGHLFQGRYKAVLIEDDAALGRVVDYVHLNPVRAGIVPAAQVRNFRWSSLAGIVAGVRTVDDRGWRAGGRFGDDETARKAYERYLIKIGQDESRWDELGLRGLSQGWAIGTHAWRQAMAKEYARLALEPGLEAGTVREMREDAWEAAMLKALGDNGHTENDLTKTPQNQAWKLTVAAHQRRALRLAGPTPPIQLNRHSQELPPPAEDPAHATNNGLTPFHESDRG
jgi:putative transposase